MENAHPGAIVLMHSSGGPSNRKATIEALPGIIEALLKEGYCFGPWAIVIQQAV